MLISDCLATIRSASSPESASNRTSNLLSHECGGSHTSRTFTMRALDLPSEYKLNDSAPPGSNFRLQMQRIYTSSHGKSGNASTTIMLQGSCVENPQASGIIILFSRQPLLGWKSLISNPNPKNENKVHIGLDSRQ